MRLWADRLKNLILCNGKKITCAILNDSKIHNSLIIGRVRNHALPVANALKQGSSKFGVMAITKACPEWTHHRLIDYHSKYLMNLIFCILLYKKRQRFEKKRSKLRWLTELASMGIEACFDSY